MATNAITALGTTLAFNSITFGEVQSLDITRNVAAIDIISCDSASSAVERIAGATDEGVLSATVVYDGSASGVADKINTALAARAIQTVLVTWSDGSLWSCSALMTSAGIALTQADGTVTQDLTFAMSGVGTYTDAV